MLPSLAVSGASPPKPPRFHDLGNPRLQPMAPPRDKTNTGRDTNTPIVVSMGSSLRAEPTPNRAPPLGMIANHSQSHGDSYHYHQSHASPDPAPPQPPDPH